MYTIDMEQLLEMIKGAGLVTLVGSLLYIGRKLQVLDSIKKEIDENIKPNLQDVRERFASLEGKASGYFEAQSPVSLTEEGISFAKESGIEKYIEDNYETFIKECNFDLDNPYDIQETAFDFFISHKFEEAFSKKIKTYVYSNGASLDVARRIAGLHFRDTIMKKNDIDQKELDKSDKENDV